MNKTMTIDEFLIALQKFTIERNTQWRINGGTQNAIRTVSEGMCPICYVCKCTHGVDKSNFDFDSAAWMLGLSVEDGHTIACTADGFRFTMLTQLRERLIKAIGAKQVVKP